MPRGQVYQRKQVEKKQANPIWRGVGCIVMVCVPLITYGLTLLITPLILKSGYAPGEILGRVKFAEWVYHVPILATIALFIAGIDNLWLNAFVFIVIIVLLMGIASVVFTSVLQFGGPPRYGEKDAPPPRVKAKPYKR